MAEEYDESEEEYDDGGEDMYTFAPLGRSAADALSGDHVHTGEVSLDLSQNWEGVHFSQLFFSPTAHVESGMSPEWADTPSAFASAARSATKRKQLPESQSQGKQNSHLDGRTTRECLAFGATWLGGRINEEQAFEMLSSVYPYAFEKEDRTAVVDNIRRSIRKQVKMVVAEEEEVLEELEENIEIKVRGRRRVARLPPPPPDEGDDTIRWDEEEEEE